MMSYSLHVWLTQPTNARQERINEMSIYTSSQKKLFADNIFRMLEKLFGVILKKSNYIMLVVTKMYKNVKKETI